MFGLATLKEFKEHKDMLEEAIHKTHALVKEELAKLKAHLMTQIRAVNKSNQIKHNRLSERLDVIESVLGKELEEKVKEKAKEDS